MKLTRKEQLFCLNYVSTGDMLNSLKLARYSPKFCNLEKALELLKNTKIQRKIQNLQQENKKKLETTVLRGLKKLAFGNVVDQVKSLINRNFENPNALKNDLFNVQEVKFTRDGGVEIKFFDRQKAMEKLHEFAKDGPEFVDSTSGLAEIFNALKNS